MFISDNDYKSKYTKKYKLKTTHFTEKIRRNTIHILNKHHIEHNHETTRAIGNAMRHGDFPVKVKVLVSKNDVLVNIKDSGKGFDYEKTISKYNNGEKYYHNHGKGTKILAKSDAKVWFKDHGKEINILYN